MKCPGYPSTAEGQGLGVCDGSLQHTGSYSGCVLAIRSPPGNCSLVGEFSTATWTHIKSVMYGVRKMQSSLVTPRRALSLLAGAGNWTYDNSGSACAASVLHWQPSARRLKGEIQCSNARALDHLQCSPFGCHSITASALVEGMIWIDGKLSFILKSHLL